MPANIIIQDPVALTRGEFLLSESTIAPLPIPTIEVTPIISSETEMISPPMPIRRAPSPTTASHAMNGKTAAAVQSTDAAL